MAEGVVMADRQRVDVGASEPLSLQALGLDSTTNVYGMIIVSQHCSARLNLTSIEVKSATRLYSASL